MTFPFLRERPIGQLPLFECILDFITPGLGRLIIYRSIRICVRDLGHATLPVCGMNKPGNINNEVISKYHIVSRPHWQKEYRLGPSGPPNIRHGLGMQNT